MTCFIGKERRWIADRSIASSWLLHSYGLSVRESVRIVSTDCQYGSQYRRAWRQAGCDEQPKHGVECSKCLEKYGRRVAVMEIGLEVEGL